MIGTIRYRPTTSTTLLLPITTTTTQILRRRRHTAPTHRITPFVVTVANHRNVFVDSNNIIPITTRNTPKRPLSFPINFHETNCIHPRHHTTNTLSTTTTQQQQQEEEEEESQPINKARKAALSVAIVGSGPSGCYTAKYLSSALQKQRFQADDDDGELLLRLERIDIDVLDRLPTPFGLVRTGVAPDHPEVKNVQNDFTTLFTNHTTNNNNTNGNTNDLPITIQFRGNITVGSQLPLSTLRSLYDIVVLAYGCEADRSLPAVTAATTTASSSSSSSSDTSTRTTTNITTGIYSAREFVAWYNGHPDFVSLGDDISRALSSPSPSSPTPTTQPPTQQTPLTQNNNNNNTIINAQVVIIGQGNVALDCARILAKGGVGLWNTDLASHAIPVLKGGVVYTMVMGRRGHVQGAFTIKELRELTKLHNEGHHTSFHVSTEELNAGMTESTQKELQGLGSRPKIRIDALLRNAAKESEQTIENDTNPKRIRLQFLTQPIEFLPHPSDPTRLGSILCERTELKGEPGKQIAVSTGERFEIPADMALISVGYKGIPLPDMDDSIFDFAKGIVRNDHGRVAVPNTPDSKCSEYNSGLYVCGWLKRGPSGIIGTNITDAKDTVASILDDLPNIMASSPTPLPSSSSTAANRRQHKRGREGLDCFLIQNNIEAVDWDGYLHIDECERDSGRKRSEAQPREKFTSTAEMLALLRELQSRR